MDLKFKKFGNEKWGIVVLGLSIFVVAVQYILHWSIAGQVNYFIPNFREVLFFGWIDLFPLFLGTAMMTHIVIEMKDQKWVGSPFALRFVKSFFVFMILVFEIAIALIGWKFFGMVATLPNFVTLSISGLFVRFVYKSEKPNLLRKWVLRLILLFSVLFFTFFIILNHLWSDIRSY